MPKQSIKLRYRKQLLKMGRHIREMREGAGMSQEQLAAEAEIPYSTVNEIEAGKTNPTVATLMGIAGALEISLSQLVDF